MEEKNDFLNAVLRTMPGGVDIVDEQMNILFMNEAFIKIFGKNSIGKKCYDVYSDDKKQCSACPLKSPIGIGDTKTIVVSGIAGNNTFKISHTGMEYQGQKVILEIFDDVTDMSLMQMELRKKVEDLEKFNKLAIDREIKMVELKKRIKELETS